MFSKVNRRSVIEVLTTKKTKTRNEQFIVPYKYEEVSCRIFDECQPLALYMYVSLNCMICESFNFVCGQ